MREFDKNRELRAKDEGELLKNEDELSQDELDEVSGGLLSQEFNRDDNRNNLFDSSDNLNNNFNELL